MIVKKMNQVVKIVDFSFQLVFSFYLSLKSINIIFQAELFLSYDINTKL